MSRGGGMTRAAAQAIARAAALHHPALRMDA